MPDDIVEEVTEQTPAEVVPEEPTATPEEAGEQDAMEAFGDEEAEPDKEPEVAKEPAEEEEEPEKEPEKEPEEPAEEIDEDTARGKELLEAEEKASAERKAPETPETPEAPAKVPYTPDDIKVFNQFADMSLLPDEVIDIDGVDVNVKSYLEEFPEARVVSGIVAKGIVDRLIENNVLVSAKSLTNLRQELANERYRDKVDLSLNTDSQKIWNDKKFQDWREKAPKEVQALFRSPDPGDAARGFKRFLNSAGLEKAGKKVAELDGKRAEAKKNADAIYKTTVRNTKVPKPSKAGDTGIEDAMDEFNRDDD